MPADHLFTQHARAGLTGVVGLATQIGNDVALIEGASPSGDRVVRRPVEGNIGGH
ncbi:hypothetical protein GALL_323440 [mine drainage metagenome]|uniref:Uncharacterized protein n=1 Tax=mine drainage metagenome TaxID=410659 RepID=A0A1J5R7V1_9ZZZZ